MLPRARGRVDLDQGKRPVSCPRRSRNDPPATTAPRSVGHFDADRVMTELRIDDVLAHPHADPAAHLDPGRVRHYATAGDDVAPVVVFDTEAGLLLVDGYHRVAAAKLRGADTVRAELRQGSREDALSYAVELAASQRGLSREAARARIREHSQGRWDATPESSTARRFQHRRLGRLPRDRAT